MLLLIDKPKGVTSHDAVDSIRKITGEKKVGHGGTLDPNSTGLLVIGVGRKSTKKLGQFAKSKMKTYDAEIFLGEERDTDDSEGVTVAKAKGLLPPTDREIRLILTSFLGEQEQIPPVYSAIKIKGRKGYELARAGKKFELKPRKISIYSIKLISYKFPIVKIKIKVSSGTYIRAVARDIGKKLGCGAYLRNLRRVRIGRYDVSSSVKIQNLTAKNWKNFAL